MANYKDLVVLERSRSGLEMYARYLGDVCEVCGTTSPERCERGNHCMICVGRSTSGDGKCYCGNCLKCYGHAGGNECNTCG